MADTNGLLAMLVATIAGSGVRFEEGDRDIRLFITV
jgi:hypothetical protein